MGLRKRRHTHFTPVPSALQALMGSRMEAFTLGEPVIVDRTMLMDYCRLVRNERRYQPPINPRGLANVLRMAPLHISAIFVKRNLLVASFREATYLSTHEFAAFVTDNMTFANAYLDEFLRCRAGS